MAKAVKPQTIKLADLIADDLNANKGTERGAKMLASSLREYGAGRSILVDKSGRIIAGNKTAEQAEAEGLQEVIVVETTGDQLVAVKRTDLDLDDPKARALALADNRVGEVSLEWDADVLADLAETLDVTQFWDEDELDELFDFGAQNQTGSADPEDAPEAEHDRAEELQSKWRTERGQLWQIGRHRLLCGDSTDEADVARLMDGKTAQFVWSDPPYGYRYRNEGSRKFDEIMNDDTMLGGFVPLAAQHSEGWVLVCTSWKVLTPWLEITSSLGKLHNLLVWHKPGGGIGDLAHTLSTDYELIMAYGRGATIKGKRTGSVWTINRDNVADYVHATQKPVALLHQVLETYTKRGDLILDPFIGSAPSIIAAEQLGRSCYGLELDPQYVAVSLERLEQFGLEPKLQTEPAHVDQAA